MMEKLYTMDNNITIVGPADYTWIHNKYVQWKEIYATMGFYIVYEIRYLQIEYNICKYFKSK